MKLNLLGAIAAASLLLVGSGCFHDATGRTRLGPPIVKDTFESRYERPVDQIFAAAKQVLAFNGTLYSENTINHSLEAKVDTRTVWVIVDEVEPNVTRVRTQARKKNKMPDLDLASEIDKQIALRLK